MSNTEFDTALVSAAFQLAAEHGWRNVSVVDAARAAGLSLAEARARFPSRLVILMRFGRLADQAALTDAPAEGPVRDRLFDLLMQRFDAMQPHRAGIRAVLRHAPFDPPLAMMLACATKRSMRWMLQAAGISTAGVRGELKVRGLLAVWLWGMRAWERDESEDLSATMAAIDHALSRAGQVAAWLNNDRSGTTEADHPGTEMHETEAHADVSASAPPYAPPSVSSAEPEMTAPTAPEATPSQAPPAAPPQPSPDQPSPGQPSLDQPSPDQPKPDPQTPSPDTPPA